MILRAYYHWEAFKDDFSQAILIDSLTGSVRVASFNCISDSVVLISIDLLCLIPYAKIVYGFHQFREI